MAKRALPPAPLAASIRALRVKLGLTQRGFAERLRVPQSTVYRWESGGASPRGENLARLGRLASTSLGFKVDNYFAVSDLGRVVAVTDQYRGILERDGSELRFRIR